MSRLTLFVDVILPLAVPNLYTYRVPKDLNSAIGIGKRVVVSFGKNKLYTAIIRNIHENAPLAYTAKYIDSVLDSAPITTIRQIELWEWMANYYMCYIGELMNASLPAGLKLESETKIVLHPLFYQRDESEKENELKILSDKEFLIVEALELHNVLTLKEVSSIIDQKYPFSVIRSLLDKGIVQLEEEIKSRFKPKLEQYIRFTDFANQESNLKEIFNLLEGKAPKKLELVMGYIKLSDRYAAAPIEVRKKELLDFCGVSTAVLNGLIKKNVFQLYDVEVGRVKYKGEHQPSVVFNLPQQKAYQQINELFQEKEVVLLHGVTSSGKTEIYIQMIEEALSKGKQVLYLLPEIALTAQIIQRLQKHFGKKVGIYHSRFNENERVEIWNGVLGRVPKGENKLSIILGARSAIFLPFDNLGLVIVDEEHDASYKQFEPSPRYNARDSAIYLSRIHGAKVLLGSATPSFESYYNARDGKYGLVELMQRYAEMQMPEILISDIKQASRKKIMKSHFAPLLIEKIKFALENKEQVILFQNRRGFAPMLECDSCAWVPQCMRCDVSLTYHKNANVLRCHYCGYAISPPKQCPACGIINLGMKGFGTEKIEEELKLYFPLARVARMDWDTTRSKNAHQQIIQNFEERKVDVLVGTQMVTKGLDFDNVSVVGILNADQMLSFPDFRSYERSYQLMAQVSGRSGRKGKRGMVIIQTYNPLHEVIHYVKANDYEALYRTQLVDREKFQYPPMVRLIAITFSHKELELLNEACDYVAGKFKEQFGKRVLGPEFPFVGRVRNLYLKNLIIKIEQKASITQAKRIIAELILVFKKTAEYRQVKVKIDVDPM